MWFGHKIGTEIWESSCGMNAMPAPCYVLALPPGISSDLPKLTMKGGTGSQVQAQNTVANSLEIFS